MSLPDDRALIDAVLHGLDELDAELGSVAELLPEGITFLEWCEDLAKKGLKVDGKPFRLDNRPALLPIYQAIPSTREEAFGRMLIIQKATQLGLTVWEVLADIYLALRLHPVTIGLFTPDQMTATKKSEHRFMRMVRSAPELYRLLRKAKAEAGATRRPAEGNVLTRTIQESILMFLWTSGKVTTESMPMDIVSLDEVQEMPLAQIDKVIERMGDSDVQFAMLLSTANIEDSDINYWYKLGTCEVWHTRCPHCDKLSDLSDPAGIFPEKSIAYNSGLYPDAPINEYVWRCPECGGHIIDPQQGEVIVTNPGANPLWRSFMLPRTISPKVTPRNMIERWQRAKTGSQKKSYWNRTLARPYIDADQMPVTMAHCLAAAAAGKAAGLTWEKRGRGCYMGIDQMAGFHCVYIMKRLPSGRQAIVHVEAVFRNPTPDSPEASPWDRAEELMRAYGVETCVVEQLPNADSARSFCNKFPGRAFMAGYADLRDDMMVWGDQMTRSDRKTAADDRSRYTVVLNQYKCMEVTLHRVRDGYTLFPDPDELEQDVIEGKLSKRVHLLRDWVFHHFTKTALVVTGTGTEDDDDEETGKNSVRDRERKPRAKVLKVGIDPHFSYAAMLANVAWARAHGTGTMIIPDTSPLQHGPNNTLTSPAPGALPVPIPEAMPPGMVCGRCTAFNRDNGQCTARGLFVRKEDPGCTIFSADPLAE